MNHRMNPERLSGFGRRLPDMPSTTEMDLGNEALEAVGDAEDGKMVNNNEGFTSKKQTGFTKKNWTSRCRIRDHHQSPHLEVDGSQGGEVYTFVLLLAMKHRQQTLPNWIDPTPATDCPRVNMAWFEHRVRKNNY